MNLVGVNMYNYDEGILNVQIGTIRFLKDNKELLKVPDTIDNYLKYDYMIGIGLNRTISIDPCSQLGKYILSLDYLVNTRNDLSLNQITKIIEKLQRIEARNDNVIDNSGTNYDEAIKKNPNILTNTYKLTEYESLRRLELKHKMSS